MHHSKMSLDDPAVSALFTDLYRSIGHKYYRMDDGRCKIFPIKQHLMSLGIEAAAATKLLKEANLPVTEFVRNRTPKPPAVMPEELVKIIKTTVERYEPGSSEPDCADDQEAAAPLPVKKSGPKAKFSHPDDAKDEATPEHEPRHKQYEIVETNSGWFGIFSNDTATTRICGRDREDAERELLALVKRKEPFQWSTVKYRQLD
jgi:hypothetical protein